MSLDVIFSEYIHVNEENITKTLPINAKKYFFSINKDNKYTTEIISLIESLTNVQEIRMLFMTETIAQVLIKKKTLNFIFCPRNPVFGKLFIENLPSDEIFFFHCERKIEYLDYFFNKCKCKCKENCIGPCVKNSGKFFEPMLAFLFDLSVIYPDEKKLISRYFNKIKSSLIQLNSIQDVLGYFLDPDYFLRYPYAFAYLFENFFVSKELKANLIYNRDRYLIWQSYSFELDEKNFCKKYIFNPFKFDCAIIFSLLKIQGMIFIYMLQSENYDFIIRNIKTVFGNSVDIDFIDDDFAYSIAEKNLSEDFKKILLKNTNFLYKSKLISFEKKLHEYKNYTAKNIDSLNFMNDVEDTL